MLLAIVLVLLSHSFWQFLTHHRDRFVVTNMRVMRIRGVFSQSIATTPIARVLDITLKKPSIGRILGYGHFVFESAAQDQGFREIRWVSRPDDRDLTIQRVIQRTGLRAAASVDVLEGDEDSDDDGTGPIGMDSAQEVITTVAPRPTTPGPLRPRPEVDLQQRTRQLDRRQRLSSPGALSEQISAALPSRPLRMVRRGSLECLVQLIRSLGVPCLSCEQLPTNRMPARTLRYGVQQRQSRCDLAGLGGCDDKAELSGRTGCDLEEQRVQPHDLAPVGRGVAGHAGVLRGDRGLQLVRVGLAIGALE